MWWPDSDRVAYKVIRSEVDFLDEAMERGRKGVCIQAGGNAGVYPLFLSDYFDQVITFEPDAENYACLRLNTSDRDNISAFHAALGAFPGKTGLNRCEENTGAHRVGGDGDILMVTIDSLGVECDFIQLDIEGHEIPALEGGRETIRACSPLIMVEDNGSGGPKGQTVAYLEGLGYHLVASNGTDYILWR